MKPAVTVLAAALLLSGCAAGRELSQQEARSFCARNGAGAALGMNPFGEEYATWMTYCHQPNTALAVAGIASGTQMMIASQPRAQQPATNCFVYPGGQFSQCY